MLDGRENVVAIVVNNGYGYGNNGYGTFQIIEIIRYQLRSLTSYIKK